MAITFYPSVVDQVVSNQNEIKWTSFPNVGDNYLLNRRWKTVSDLVHYSNPASGDYRNKTCGLLCTGFNIPVLESLHGIQLRLVAQRQGRIVDETIQLSLRGNLIGKNNFVYRTDSEGHLPLLNDTTYGGESDLWATDLTPRDISDPSFGVFIKFQSHPYCPHKQSIYVDSVMLTVF